MSNPKQPATEGTELTGHPSKRIRAELRTDLRVTTLKCPQCGVVFSNATNHP